MEEWRTVIGFRNYEVSDEGRIRNSKTGRIMKTSIDKRGYEKVCLRESGTQDVKLVHRLVVESFLGNISGLDITHSDGNRSNNNLYNLDVKTRSENLKDTYRNGRRQLHKMKKVICVETGEVFESIVDCAEAFNTSPKAISRCVNNPVLANKDGYHFKPVDY